MATKEGTRYEPLHPWPRTIVSPPWRMCNFNGELVGGAVFTTTNNHTLGFAVGKLVNNEWVLLGGEFNDLVLDLVVYKGELYAAGIFTEAGAKKVPFLGRWSGEAWEPVAEFSGPVATLAVYDDKLVAGGLFDRVNGELMNNISAWNGESWENLDGGITGDALVLDAFVHQGTLIATGEFRWAGPMRIQSIAMWNGSSWAAIGNLDLWSQSSRIDRAMSWGDEIVVASSYLQEDWGELATWNGHSWKPVFPRLFGSVYLLEEYRGNLVVGGRLSVERGRRHKLLQYDHDRWSSFGREEEGVVGSADSFLPFGDGFYVAGGFRVTGSDASLILGHWDGKDQTFSPVPVAMTIAPNPARSRAIVSWSDAPVGVGTLTVYDIRGRRVRTLYENDTTQTKGASIWDLRDDNDVRVASGVYFMKLESRAGSVSKKVVVTR
ncbi:MAG: T9SS type A sorting domain-containing protein [Candidatus Eisenbacteria bacterium]|uniref:T9SS type A sorting domain-containing protein n=1 Tax=Eiseniibacteriota bacterium TaxID=2212470 RepID=A0A7Y2EB92_UNCEI|nr:T9SS type A sorting domain-containing protein [Candidatus Eisenbacteria bacterium]